MKNGKKKNGNGTKHVQRKKFPLLTLCAAAALGIGAIYYFTHDESKEISPVQIQAPKNPEDVKLETVINNFKHNAECYYDFLIARKPDEKEADEAINKVLNIFGEEVHFVCATDISTLSNSNAIEKLQSALADRGYFLGINKESIPEINRIYGSMMLSKIAKKETETIQIFDQKDSLEFILLSEPILKMLSVYADEKAGHKIWTLGMARDKDVLLFGSYLREALNLAYDNWSSALMGESKDKCSDYLIKEFGSTKMTQEEFMAKHTANAIRTVKLHESAHHYIRKNKILPDANGKTARENFLERMVPSETMALLNELMNGLVPYYTIYCATNTNADSQQGQAILRIADSFSDMAKERNLPGFDSGKPAYQLLHKLSKDQIREFAKEMYYRRF